MNKTKVGIFLPLLSLIGLTSCGGQKSNNKLVLNEILINNQNNFQDDHGLHSTWIKVFNKSFGSAGLVACLLEVSSQPGDTVTHFIPKGDILTLVRPRQHALLWTGGEPNRGTFHTSFKLNPETANQVGLFDSGRKLLDQIAVPTDVLGPNQSYACISDGAAEWEVEGGGGDKYVTPSMNNKTFDNNARMEEFEEHDVDDVSMSISVMNVVFCGLILLFIVFKIVGKVAVNLSRRNVMKSKGIDKHEAKELSQVPGEVYAAISMALYGMQDKVHDVKETVLTITRMGRSYSSWSSKIYTSHEAPPRE